MIKIPKNLFLREVSDLNVPGYSSEGIVVFSSMDKARICYKDKLEFTELAEGNLVEYLKSIGLSKDNKQKTIVFNLKDDCKYDAVYSLEELIELLQSKSFCEAKAELYDPISFTGLLNLYDFQSGLTFALDKQVNKDFDQAIINEIVLWKVNRYVPTNTEDNWLSMLNEFKNHKDVESDKLRNFLNCVLDSKVKGIRLAMASTFLRFRNPEVYQIIDERMFRVVMRSEESKKMLGNYTKKDEQIDLYIKYLGKLQELCKSKDIEFKDSDRILYQFDIIKNGDFNQSGKV